MSIRRLLPTTALACIIALGAATPAHAGPPWISIELPANPLDPTTRGAYLLVHTFHHEAAIRQLIEGRAEGLVNGRRQTIPLSFTATSRDFVQALKKSWPDGGTWVLVISTGGHGDATALVGIGADGQVHSIAVPSEVKNGWTVPKKVTGADVDAILTTLAAADLPAGGQPGLALALGGLLILPAGFAFFRRVG